MRLLERNLKDLKYLPYEGESDIDPTTGRHTGDPVPHYGEPIPFRGNISTPSQYVNPTFYGQDVRYTHTLLLDLPDEFTVDEYGLVRDGEDTYEIRAVRESLNCLSVALRKQTKNNAEGEKDEP